MTDPDSFQQDADSLEGSGVSPALVQWTHEALERLFDLAFLDRHARAACVEGRYANGRALHEVLQDAIRQLRPPMSVPAHSPAWRAYNTLNLRYAQGLSQAEVAGELGLSVRHLKRVQEKAIYAAAALLFEQVAPEPGSAQPLQSRQSETDRAGPGEEQEPAPFAASGSDFVRLDDLLNLSLRVVEPLFERRSLRVRITMPPALPSVRADRVLARQLFISALSWLARGLSGCEAAVRANKLASQVTVQFVKPAPAPMQHTVAEGVEGVNGGEGEQDEIDTIQQLAGALGLTVDLARGADGDQMLDIRLPISETKLVLLVEDNPDAIELVQRYLEGNGEFHVVPVSQPGEAVKRAAEMRPACVVLDVMMPEHDGWELLTAFKSNPDTSHIPVIISSVIRGQELARALGADGVLPKPYSAAELTAGLRAATRRSLSAPPAIAR